MKRVMQTILLSVTLALPVLGEDQKESSEEPLRTEAAVLVSVTGTVQAVDPAKREVTLKGPLGNTVTFAVAKRVRRFNEIKAGDNVTANYYISLAGELREPTTEEKETPITVLNGLARAPEGTEPAAGGLHQVKVVTSVEGLDLPTRTVTLKGPRGNYVTVRPQEPNNLKKLRLGDTIVVTYTEALAVSLEKVPATKVE
jgi:Cu/Ag efflux protein CusF